jgi:hypothetical protein
VPSSPVPAGDAPARGPIPTSVRVAVIAMAVLAGLLLLNAALTWFGREGVVDAIVKAGTDVDRAEAMRFVVLWLVPYLILGVVLALSAWFLPRGRAWARWTGLAGSFLLGALILLSMLSSGGATIASLLLLVLSIAAVTSLLARSTGAWVPRLRSNS